jgi:hypothetical protein
MPDPLPGLRRRMSDGEQKPLTPKAGCAECQEFKDRVESARKDKSYTTSSGSGYRPEKSGGTDRH